MAFPLSGSFTFAWLGQLIVDAYLERIMEQEQPQTPPSQKPSWLQVLEAESWQAELVISGIAIFGTLQLPHYIGLLSGWFIFNVVEEISTLTYLLTMYLSVAAAGLILFFLIHFVMRALWIASLGLSSVYPEGIRLVENAMVTVRMLRRLREDLGNLDNFNEQLDRTCSSLLAAAFLLVLGTLGITVFLCGLIFVFLLIQTLFPTLDSWLPVFALFMVIPLMTILTSIANLPRFREHPLVKQYHYPVYRLMTRIFFNVGYRPFIILQSVFLTNIDLRQYYLRFFAAFIVVMIAGFVMMFQIDAFIQLSNNYIESGTRTNLIRASFYEDRRNEGDLIVSPLLPSADVETPRHLTVFVPFIRRERDLLLEACPYPDSLSSNYHKRNWQLQCVPSQYSFVLNTDTLTNFTVLHHLHPNRGERGLLFHLYDLPFRQGLNWLYVQTPLRTADEGPHTVAVAQFYHGPPLMSDSIPAPNSVKNKIESQ